MPVGQEQLALLLPVVTVLTAGAWYRGLFAVNRWRLVLVAVLTGTACAVTLVQIVAGVQPSILSVGLLVVLYLPAVLRPRGDREVWRPVARFFVRVMEVAAVVSVGQFVLQSANVTVPDYLQQYVPKQYLLQDFNTGNAISYGSAVNRATAFVFLEPSFLSLFLGLAIVLALQLRLRWPTMTILLAGIAPTVAGNGVLLIAGAVVVFLIRDRRALIAMVPGVAVAAVALVATPLGALFLQRSTEGGGSNSSTGLRFVQPYVELLQPPLSNPLSALIGRGAGAVTDYITANHLGALLATPLPRALFGFGLIGVVGVLLPVLILLLAPLRRQPELIGFAFAFFVANDSLQTALLVAVATVFVLWLPDLAARPREFAPWPDRAQPQDDALVLQPAR